jgi:hypothetical protein
VKEGLLLPYWPHLQHQQTSLLLLLLLLLLLGVGLLGWGLGAHQAWQHQLLL